MLSESFSNVCEDLSFPKAEDLEKLFSLRYLHNVIFSPSFGQWNFWYNILKFNFNADY
jgi:hypothetical protein